MVRIPRGVFDQASGLVVTRDRQGCLVAIGAGTGVVSWRAGAGLRPCAIAGDAVVAVRVMPGSLTVVVVDAGDGREQWAAEPVALPAWANPTLDDSQAFALRVQTAGSVITIRWSAHAAYKGGAHAGPGVLAEQAHEAGGELAVELATRSVRASPAPAEPPPLRPPAPAPDVLDHAEVAGVRFDLVVAGGAVSLRAVDMTSAATLWQVVLDDVTKERPRMLRK